MKTLYILFIGLLVSGGVMAQSCLPEGIYFETQAQIDSFQINYPGCSKIEGDVLIGQHPSTDIENLIGLNVLTSIGGELIIHYNPLVNLTGLEGITTVGGGIELRRNNSLNNLSGLNNLILIVDDLNIFFNDSLESLSGLESLMYIGGSLTMQQNDLINSMIGLDNLTKIGGGLQIRFHGGLSSLTGLENLNEIEDFLVISGTALENLTGLDGLQFVGESLIIGDWGTGGQGGNPDLINLTGLEELNSIGGWLDINNNSTLTDLTGLENLTSIDGGIYINKNMALNSITSISNIAESTIEDLYIVDNDNLSSCDVENICDYLSNPNGTVTIEDNAPGCNSQEEVMEACGLVSIDELIHQKQFAIYPNPANQELNISLEGYTIDEVTIYTITGQQILQGRPVNGTLDISDLKPGMYIVEVTIENTRVRKKLLVQR